MRIGVDARELEGRRTGVGRYVDELLRAIARSDRAREHAYVLYARQPVDVTPYAGLNVSVAVAAGGGVSWEQVTLPRLLRRTRADLLFAPGYTAPLCSPCPVVLVVHDVSFSVHPEWFGWREGARRRTLTRLAAARAACVLTVSEFSKHEIAAHLGIPLGKIVVVPNGVTHFPGDNAALADEPVILFLGSVFNRRHVPELIHAVGELVRRGHHPRLEIVGDNRTNPRVNLNDIALATGIADRVRIRNYVADDQIGECYRRARAFAFPSDYEGFGLTPLEALSAGVPIVVLDSRVTREIYGDAAIYAPAATPHALADALTTALFDEGQRAARLTAAHSVLSRYDWSRAADRVLGVITHVAGHAPARVD